MFGFGIPWNYKTDSWKPHCHCCWETLLSSQKLVILIVMDDRIACFQIIPYFVVGFCWNWCLCIPCFNISSTRSRWLWSRLIPQSSYSPVKGLYLYGGVGTGKTMLMDLFFEQLYVCYLHFLCFFSLVMPVSEPGISIRRTKNSRGPPMWAPSHVHHVHFIPLDFELDKTWSQLCLLKWHPSCQSS